VTQLTSGKIVQSVENLGVGLNPFNQAATTFGLPRSPGIQVSWAPSILGVALIVSMRLVISP